MDNELMTDRADRINIIHSEMTGHMMTAVKKAIEIGRLLTEQKEQLAHGEWIPWIRSNIVFSERQANKYMQIYSNKNSGSYLLDGATSINKAVALLA